MSAARVQRLWIVGGALLALVLAAAVYMFVISPARNETASLQAQTADAQTAQAAERRKLAQLVADSAQLGSVKASVTAAQAALPSTVSSADFLRTLQSIAQAQQVVVTAVSIQGGGEGATTVPDANGLIDVPVGLDVQGGPVQLFLFLDQLQDVQPRAVTVGSVTTAVSGDGVNTLHVELTMFVAPVGG